ncbi:MAG TPA: hypothetical protein VHE35_10110 [Kofleriaceae bacterium]|nr:hypothetical protein [Kofleriaceae bacterium]
MTRRAPLLLTLGLACALPHAAAAQVPTATIEAEQLFKEGKRLMAAGDYAQACEAFEGSLRQDPAVSTRLNLADCREKNQQYASAWGHFIAAAHDARGNLGESQMKQVAEARAAALEPRLSHLIINVADEARIDGLVITRNGEPVDPATWNRDLPVDGGTYVIAGKAPGYEPWSTTVTVHAAEDKQSVNVPRFASLAGPAAVTTADTGAAADTATTDASVRPSRLTGRRKLALVAWTLSAGGAATAITFELSGRGAYADAVASPDNAARHSLTADANRDRTIATIAGATAAATLATGLYLWFSGRPHPVTLVPTPSADAPGATLVGRF